MEHNENLAFQPYEYKNITLNGRIARSSTELFSSEKDGAVSQVELKLYESYTSQPLGAIFTAHTCVMPEGRSNIGQNAVWDDCFADGHIEIARLIHLSKYNTKAVMQLGHGGMRGKGYGGLKIFTPDNMTVSEISDTIKHFASAALRAKKWGYDGVQLHGAHGYLLSEFFYPEYNHRTDIYGGGAENRFRIIREAAEAIKSVCGDDYPVFLKLNSNDAQNSAEYQIDVGKALRQCGECGIEAVELSGYVSSPPGNPEVPYFLKAAAVQLQSSPVPLMLVGGFRTRESIESALRLGFSSVSLCRPLINDPELVEKLYSGGGCGCIGCNKCFSDGCCHK